MGLERCRVSALDIAAYSLKSHDFGTAGLTTLNLEIFPCAFVWGYLGGIAERPNWLAIPPKGADELHRPKQYCRGLASGIQCAPDAGALRAYGGCCGTSANHLKADRVSNR